MNKKAYFLNMILILAAVTLVFVYLGGDILWAIDGAAILFILILSVPSILMSSGIKAFVRYHKIALSPKKRDPEETKKALICFKLIRRNLTAAGIIGASVGLIVMLGNLYDTSHVGPALATTLITVLYSFLLQLIWTNPLLKALEEG